MKTSGIAELVRDGRSVAIGNPQPAAVRESRNAHSKIAGISFVSGSLNS